MELQMELRGELSKKQQVVQTLEKAFLKAQSPKNFYCELQSSGLELYSRNKKIVGVKHGRKFRFKSLGYDDQLIKSLDKDLGRQKRSNAIYKIRKMMELRPNDKTREDKQP